MGKRIKDLTTTSSPANDDYLPVDSANSGTRKISASLITGKQDAIIAGTNITIAADGKTISATDTTYSAGTNVQINNGVISATDTTYSTFTGATASADGSAGLVPQPLVADKDKYLKGDGTWATVGGGGGGSTVTITPTSSTGTKIADYTIDGTSGALFAPNGSGGDITTLDFSDMTNTQISDMMDNLNNGVVETDSGTFVTGNAQYAKVEVNCGFRPSYIQVILPFGSGDTTAVYDASISTTTSTWTIPQEGNTYTITLGSETGETGITDITDTGFKFRCNAPNTRNVQCTYSASVSSLTYVQTIDFTQLTQTQIDDLKTLLGIS